jgi:hypothetical protein
VRFKIFTSVTTKITLVSVLLPSHMIVTNISQEHAAYLLARKVKTDGCSIFFRNVGKYQSDIIASQPKGLLICILDIFTSLKMKRKEVPKHDNTLGIIECLDCWML